MQKDKTLETVESYIFKKQRREKMKNNKGITLIVLVVTIIVILILVGVTISMAVNGGLFDYAGQAAKRTNDILKSEQQLADGGVRVGENWYNSIDEYLVASGNKPISKETSYVGYYADVDGNGTVDGVIYADLAIGGEGSWRGQSYSYEAETDLKDYYVSGTHEGAFSEEAKGVLTATGTGNDRFYVMALENVTTADYTYFYWYYNAYGNMSDYATATSLDFEAGKANTATIKGIWDADTGTPYGTQNAKDLWAQIDLTSGWFVPSIAEWAAFGDAFGVNNSNYSDTYGLGDRYWSSSQYDAGKAVIAYFEYNLVGGRNIDSHSLVRLSATF